MPPSGGGMEDRMKRFIYTALALIFLLQSSAFAGGQVRNPRRAIGGSAGWVDSFEEEMLYPPEVSIPRTTLTNQSNTENKNRFIITDDPLGINGRCMKWEYGIYSTAGSSTNRNNPTFEPIFPTHTFEIGGGDCQLAFDMYMPAPLPQSGADSASVLLQVFPKYTGSTSSSDYQNITIAGTTLQVPGFPACELPTGRWFNIKYILHCGDTSKGVFADLYVDNAEIGKNVPAVFRLMNGNGTKNIEQYGINSVRFTLGTTNGQSEIEPPYALYIDNMDIRKMSNIEMLSYMFMSNYEASDTLKNGPAEFSVRLRNLGDTDTVPMVGTALYCDGELVEVNTAAEKTLAAGSDGIFSVGSWIDMSEESEYELRTFVWNNADELLSVTTQMTFKE